MYLDITALSLNVKADVLLALGVGGVQFADHLLGLHTAVLSQHTGNNFQGLGKPNIIIMPYKILSRSGFKPLIKMWILTLGLDRFTTSLFFTVIISLK